MKRFFAITAGALASRSLVVAGMLLMTTERASAYIDVGTGSLVIQALIGTVFAILGVLGRWWMRLRGKQTKGKPLHDE